MLSEVPAAPGVGTKTCGTQWGSLRLPVGVQRIKIRCYNMSRAYGSVREKKNQNTGKQMQGYITLYHLHSLPFLQVVNPFFVTTLWMFAPRDW